MVLATQGLHNKIGYYTTVADRHAGAVGVENADDLGAHTMQTVVVKEQGLCTALALVVARTQSDGVDVAPIGLGLRMDVGVAIDLAGRGLQNLSLGATRQTQHVVGPEDAGLGSLYGVVLIVDR